MAVRTLSNQLLSTKNYNKNVSKIKGSVLFSTGGFLAVPGSNSWVFSGDHTIEAWIKPTDTTVFNLWATGGTGANDQFLVSGGSSANATVSWCYASVGGFMTTSATIPTGSWTHVAVSRSGTTLRAFVGGTVVATNTVSGSVGTNTTAYIGKRSDGQFQIPNGGYISNLRISTSALYTGNFTVPGSALSPTASTVLLTCQNPSTIVDNSGNNVAITASSVSASSASPF